MANPVKGEVLLEIGGKKFIFVLGTYALAALERNVGMPWPKLFQKAKNGEWGMSETLATFHAGLLRHQKKITEEEAADLMDVAGIDYINEKLGEAIKLMQPAEGGEGEANPPMTKTEPEVGTTSSQIGSQ